MKSGGSTNVGFYITGFGVGVCMYIMGFEWLHGA